MLTFRNHSILTLIISSSFFLTGCSLFEDFFIQNKTDKKVTTVIKFAGPIGEYMRDSFSIQLRYADTILDINDKTQNALTQKLNYTTLNSETIVIDLPPKSTVLIGGSINRPLSADSTKFIKDGNDKTYSLNKLYKKTKKTGGLFPPFHLTYTIE